MIKSMTGFGRAEAENDDMSLSIEIKTVNHKYIDYQIRMPNYLNFLEDKIKKTIKDYLSRGRIEVYIKVDRKFSNNSKVELDLPLANSINNSLKALIDELDIHDEVKLNHLLRYDDILTLKYDDIDEDNVSECVISTLEEALQSLLVMRKTEGDRLKTDLQNNLDSISLYMEKIETRTPYLVEEYKERLTDCVKNLVDNSDAIDNDRLNLEIVLYAEKSDINEELVRMKSHILSFKETLNMDIPVGRKLDFIIQEMNREVNTISSKSNDTELTQYVIEVKSLIEKLREQIQNIE